MFKTMRNGVESLMTWNTRAAAYRNIAELADETFGLDDEAGDSAEAWIAFCDEFEVIEIK